MVVDFYSCNACGMDGDGIDGDGICEDCRADIEAEMARRDLADIEAMENDPGFGPGL